MGNCFSKVNGESGEERVSVAPTTLTTSTTAVKLNTKETTIPPVPKVLISGRPNMNNLKEEKVDPEKAAVMLGMGIQVIDLFQKVAAATEMVLPSPLGDILEKVTSVLGVLKVSSKVPVREHLSKSDWPSIRTRKWPRIGKDGEDC